MPTALLVQRLPHGRDRSVILPVSVTDFHVFADGSYLLGGSFSSITHIGGSALRRSLAKFNANGVLDTTVLQVNGNGFVEAIAPAADGKIYIAGSFTSLNTGAGGNVAATASPVSTPTSRSTPPSIRRAPAPPAP